MKKILKKKFKVASYLTPLSTALFANSAIKENKFSGYLSYRSKIWQSTSRAGLPEIFLDEMSFEKYADFVLNYPLLFFKKNNEYLFPEGKTYFDLIKQDEADKQNLELHLSTIFTEVRLKSYIEIRSLDACEWDCHCAGPAFFIGLLYGNLDESYEIINKWQKKSVLEAYFNSPSKGFNTEIEGKNILYWSDIFTKISKEGLKNRNKLNSKNNNETIYLKNIDTMIIKKSTKAEDSVKNLKK